MQQTTKKPIFKKTADEFKKRYKISLFDAPLYVLKDNFLWKLIMDNGVYSKKCGRSAGRKFEYAEYAPVIETKGRFKTKFQSI